MDLIHAAICWLLNPPVGGEAKDALIAIASVAAVLWTGGLITFQLKKASLELIVGLDYLQNVFMGSCLVLFVVGFPLRCVIFVFFVLYTSQSIIGMIQARRLMRRFRAGEIIFKHKDGNYYFTDRYAKTQKGYAYWTLFTMLGYVALFVWPTQMAMNIFGWSFMYLGMQLILRRLNSAEPIKAPQEKPMPVRLPFGAIHPIAAKDDGSTTP